jgi:hypothetical protein
MEGRVKMEWRTVGRPGYCGRRWRKRERELNQRYGHEGWRLRIAIATDLCGEPLDFADAAAHCDESYLQFLREHKDLLHWLCANARDVYETAVSNIRSGLDYRAQERRKEHYQDIALRNALQRLGRTFTGEKRIRIGGRRCDCLELSAGQVPFYRPEWILQPTLASWWRSDSIECFWHSNKVLQIKL